ncbi:MAG: YfhO family protein [Candidatus Magnetomorum sp.]|nr:YfhO family protein [Candidatus Magnetomorum sp.]
MNRHVGNFSWVPMILVILLTFPFSAVLLSDDPVGSAYPDTDLDYFLRLHQASFKSQTFFPQWNPQDVCGAPILSEIQAGLFYPPNLMFRWLPMFKAVSFFFWFHTLLLSLFTYFLARHLNLSKPAAMLSAVTFSCCGHLVLGIYAGKLSNIATLTWLPLLLILICRIKEKQNSRCYICMGLVLAMQFYAGHFQYMYYSLILVFLFYQYKIRLLQKKFCLKPFLLAQMGFFCAVIIGLFICLPQLISVMAYLKHTCRSTLSIAQAGHFSFPMDNILTLLVPGIFGDMKTVAYWGVYNLWEMCAYCGVMPFVLGWCVFKEKPSGWVYFFFWAGIISFGVALGENTPLFSLLYNGLPGFSWFRGHSKAIAIFCLCLSLMAGKGLDTLRSSHHQGPETKYIRTTWIMIAIACLLLIISQTRVAHSLMDAWMVHIIAQPGQYLPIDTIMQVSENRIQAIHSSIHVLAKGLIWLIVSLWIILRCQRWSVNTRTIVILVISLTELIGFARLYIQPIDASNFQRNAPVMDFFKQDTSCFRVLDLSYASFEPLSNLQTITGDRPYIWDRYTRFINGFLFHQPVASMKLPPIGRMSDGFHMMNVKYILQQANRPIPCENCVRRYADHHVDIYENLDALDRVYLAEKVIWTNTQDDTLKHLTEKDIINGQCVLIEPLKQPVHKQTRFNIKDSSVEIRYYSNDQVIVHARMSAPGWLILNDTWSEGWQAVCDETKRLDIHIANYIFRAVFVPAGNHDIRFVYSPPGFLFSMVVAFVTLGVSMILIVFLHSNFLNQIRPIRTLLVMRPV